MLIKPYRCRTELARKHLTWKYRQLTWRNRSLPHFIIFGAHKSGSTSLYHYLSGHPQLMPSYIKEPHFFDGGINTEIDTFNKGEAWYRSHFPLYRDLGEHQKTFEASPLYIFNPVAPQRIAKLVPKVKLIAILRNPTERAISHYYQEKRSGREALSILDALQAEEERLKPVLERQDYKSNTYRLCSYKKRGLYLDQIKRYLRYFTMNDILIINSESLFMEPTDTLRRVCQFVEIDTDFSLNNFKIHNVGKHKTAVDLRVIEYLDDYFRPHNLALYEFLGHSFDW